MPFPKVDIPSCCEVIFSFALSGFASKVTSEHVAGSLLTSLTLQRVPGVWEGHFSSPMGFCRLKVCWRRLRECLSSPSSSGRAAPHFPACPGVHHRFGSFPGLQAPFPVFPVETGLSGMAQMEMGRFPPGAHARLRGWVTSWASPETWQGLHTTHW